MNKYTSLIVATDIRLQRSKEFELNISEMAVSAGEIVCLVGANGSGKTTFVDILSGLISPKRGKIKICGHELSRDSLLTKRMVGFVPDDDSWLINELTATEYF